MRLIKDDSGSVGWVLLEMVMALVAGGLAYLLLSVFYSDLQTGIYNSQSSTMVMNNSTAQGFNVLAYAWQNAPLLIFLIVLAGGIIAAIAYRLRAV